MKFKHFNTGANIENLALYIDDYISKNSDCEYEVFLGTDSKRKRFGTYFISVIALYRKGKGAHLIYKKEKKDKKLSMFEKLWLEVETSLEIAEYLRSNSTHMKDTNITIHLDINIDEKFKSNKILDAATGYVKSMGYLFEVKNNAWVATVAADKLCRR